jgi:hypothetical protein
VNYLLVEEKMTIDLALAIHQIDPTAEYRLSDAHAQTADDILEWRSSTTPKPTQAQLQAAWKMVDDARKQKEGKSEATLAQLQSQVGALVGKSFSDLKNVDVVALMGAVLWSVGALNDEGKVEPLEQWALRRQES